MVGINNANQSFIIPSAIGLVYNGTIILGVIFLGSVWGIYGLAVGSLIGVILQFLMQLPSAYKAGLRFKFNFDYKNEGLREVLKLVLPFTLLGAIEQINLVVDRTLATSLPTGSVSALYFSNKLIYLPYGVIITAVATVIYPVLVEAASKFNYTNLIEQVIRAFRLTSILLIPSLVGIIVLKEPLVKLIFQRGEFTYEDTILTAGTLPYFLGAVYFGAIIAIVLNAFFAMKMMKVAVVTGIITVVSNILLSLYLVNIFHHKGLALANSLANLINLTLLLAVFYYLVRGYCKVSQSRSIMMFSIKISVASAIMGLVVWYINKAFTGLGINEVILMGFNVIIGLIVYLFLSSYLKVEEIRDDFFGLIIKIIHKMTTVIRKR
ncbi:polysaccharide biosynthesis C-terminal domain-containing protein [Paenibacillus sp. CC-CFT747]|nr:polysaccharide biosynthesis C-terminal domain-containing protein [Paenibacillus sp. CC-CFT747]